MLSCWRRRRPISFRSCSCSRHGVVSVAVNRAGAMLREGLNSGLEHQHKDVHMSIISFIKEAGEHLFKRPHPAPDIRPLPGKPAAAAADKPDVDALEMSAAKAIKNYVASKGLPADKLDIDFDAN